MTSAPLPKSTGLPLREMLDLTHPLVKLAQAIDWAVFAQAFGPLYAEAGRGSVPIRIMVGVHYLKHTCNESDESVVTKWVENPYWQYFCGCETFQHELPCHPTSLVKWRQRIGATGMATLLKGILQTALKVQALPATDVKQVTVDTTVQEKAIAFPTDARLYHKARRTLVRLAKASGLKLRQTYARVSPRLLQQQSRYAAARQMKRAARHTRKLRTILGRVIRDVERKCPQPPEALRTVLECARRIHTQQRDPGDYCRTPKLYSVHAPDVECLAKGKAHKRYEFGCKVAVSSTTHSNWLVGIQAHHANPYDGATLKPALVQIHHLTGVSPEQALVDQGFRGQEHHPAGVSVVITRFTTKASATVKRLFKRRNAIEPIIGHAKSDHGLARNYLRGTQGDLSNALRVGCGFNLAKLLHFFAHAQPVWTCV